MKRVLSPLLAFCLPFALYWYSLAPTFLWSDSSKLALQVFHRQIYTFSHGEHPLHTLLGLLFARLPFELAVTQHLLSAFFGALTVLLLFFLFRILGHRDDTSLVGALLIGVSHSFWLYSVITETYTLHAFFLILLLLLVQTYRKTSHSFLFPLIFFCLGLALYNHSSAILFVLPLTVLVFAQSPFRRRSVPAALLAFAIGFSPIFLLPAYKLGFLSALKMVFQDTGIHVVTFVMVKKIVQEWWKFPLYLGYQFPSIALLAGFLGFSRLKQRDASFHWTVSAIFVLNIGLALIYFLQRQFALLISSYLIFDIWIVAGLDHPLFNALWGTRRRLRLLSLFSMLLFPFLVYHSFPELYKKSGSNLIHIRELPYRDSIPYFFTPDKHKVTGARVYAEEVFGLVEEGAVIVGDFNPGMALAYYQEVKGVRPDVSLVLGIDHIHFFSQDEARDLIELLEEYQDSALYLADSYEPYYHVSQLAGHFTLRRLGPIIKVEPKR